MILCLAIASRKQAIIWSFTVTLKESILEFYNLNTIFLKNIFVTMMFSTPCVCMMEKNMWLWKL